MQFDLLYVKIDKNIQCLSAKCVCYINWETYISYIHELRSCIFISYHINLEVKMVFLCASIKV